MLRPSLAAASFLLLPAIACTPEPEPERAPVTFVLPTGERTAFLDTPYPSDLLVKDDGTLDFRAFPNPYDSAALEDYLAIFAHAPGFAGSSTLYFKVDGGVDESTLPATPAASMNDDSGLFVVELDGPLAGRRLPIEWRHYPDGTSFLPAGTVAVNLLLGAVPQGRFALVATSTVHRADGVPLGPSDDLRALLSCTLPATLDRDVDCTAAAQVLTDSGLAIYDVALVQSVTPQQSTAGLVKAYDVARAYVPTVSDVVQRADDARLSYLVFDGTITIAAFQAGTAPFDTQDGVNGGFVFDDDGVPAIQREEVVPFVLTVPRGDMPAAGWPAVVYGHGTGGDLESGLGRSAGSEAVRVTAAGSAMLAISEPLHRTRLGHRAGQEEILTFNFFNPFAGRDNWRQSALEKVQQVTALQTLRVRGVDDVEHHFDAEHLSYFGHSQGGIVGALFVALEDRITGALLSGAGAGLAPSLIEKTEPIVIADVLKTALLMPSDDVIDTFHPIPSLLQTFVDPADPLNYGPLWRHREGRHTPHLVVTSGQLDTFTPPRNHAGLAGSYSVPLASPIAAPLPVLSLLGIDDVGDTTVSGNLRTDDDAPLTAAVVQYPVDGHFAVFDNPVAQALVTEFFTSLHTDDVPTVHTTLE
jgi:pimeloyl-ACP methyl ester carboxylesterase